jgi:DNA-binding CsgD family transcriptional regulator
MLDLVQDLVADALAADNPLASVQVFRARLGRMGPSYLQVRRYLRPGGALTSDLHWQAGGVLTRDARQGWVGSSGFQYICFECNPLLAVVDESRTRYRASDVAPFTDRRYRDYWDAFETAAIADVWGANAYGRDQKVASVHIGFNTLDVDEGTGKAVQLASSILAEHLLELDSPFPPQPRRAWLTVRERDAMRFVAQGKTDWEIGMILGVSETTARFHVDNARRKLAAVNRAHAVARFIAEHGVG